jgi:hypothetical protein
MRTYNVLAPENADEHKARFKVKLLPEPEADELAALTVHWLFCSAVRFNSDGRSIPTHYRFATNRIALTMIIDIQPPAAVRLE